MRTISFFLLCAASTLAQSPAKVTYENIPGVQLSTGQIDVIVLPAGATLAGIAETKGGPSTNPLWNPIRMNTGGGASRGGRVGHFICVDGFGPVSPEEQAAGLSGHGEAHSQQFEISISEKSGSLSTVRMSARLPLVQENFTRTFRVVDGENVLYVDSELESLVGFDRPAVWAEHATIGSPFLAPGKTVVDLSGSRSQVRPYGKRPGGLRYRMASGKDFTWPNAPAADGQTIDLRVTPQAGTGGHTATLMKTGSSYAWATAINLETRRIVGWLFNPEEYPWLQNWENYMEADRMARGLEFSTQPYDVPRRQAVTTGTMFDAPTYRWLPAKSKITTRFVVFYASVPNGFRKVDEIAVEKGQLRIRDRAAGRELTLKASLPLW